MVDQREEVGICRPEESAVWGAAGTVSSRCSSVLQVLQVQEIKHVESERQLFILREVEVFRAMHVYKVNCRLAERITRKRNAGPEIRTVWTTSVLVWIGDTGTRVNGCAGEHSDRRGSVKTVRQEEDWIGDKLMPPVEI